MAAAKAQPGHSIVTTTFVELLGVAVFTVMAGFSDDMGSLMVVLMWGILLGWALLHTSQLQTIVSALLWATNFGKSLPCSS